MQSSRIVWPDSLSTQSSVWLKHQTSTWALSSDTFYMHILGHFTYIRDEFWVLEEYLIWVGIINIHTQNQLWTHKPNAQNQLSIFHRQKLRKLKVPKNRIFRKKKKRPYSSGSNSYENKNSQIQRHIYLDYSYMKIVRSFVLDSHDDQPSINQSMP